MESFWRTWELQTSFTLNSEVSVCVKGIKLTLYITLNILWSVALAENVDVQWVLCVRVCVL